MLFWDNIYIYKGEKAFQQNLAMCQKASIYITVSCRSNSCSQALAITGIWCFASHGLNLGPLFFVKMFSIQTHQRDLPQKKSVYDHFQYLNAIKSRFYIEHPPKFIFIFFNFLFVIIKVHSQLNNTVVIVTVVQRACRQISTQLDSHLQRVKLCVVRRKTFNKFHKCSN